MDDQILGSCSVMAARPGATCLWRFSTITLFDCSVKSCACMDFLSFVLMSVEQELFLETLLALMNLTGETLRKPYICSHMHTIKAGHHRHWTHFAFWQWSQPNSHCLKELLFYKSPATDDVPLNPIKEVGIKWSSRSLISDDIWTNLPTGILKKYL